MKKNSFPFYRQLDSMDCGPTCLKMMAKFHGKEYSIDFLRKKSRITKEGTSFETLIDASESIGFRALPIEMNFNKLKFEVTMPLIVHWQNKHFVIVYRIKKNRIFVADPAIGLVNYTKDDFIKNWLNDEELSSEGFALLLNPTPKFFYTDKSEEKLNSSFLFKYFKPYKKYLIQLFLGLFIGSLIQLILPFLTQSIVDYGINYQNISFISLILIAQLTLFISSSIVSVIRSWLLLHMTSRINIQLLSDFLYKMMLLPLTFFENKHIGDIVQRINDHNRVRNFLSGNTLNTIFSSVNLIIFGAVLIYYNLSIFLVFMFGSIAYVLWTFIFLKRREALDHEKFVQAAKNQSLIYQFISSIKEIKLNGSQRRRRWEWEGVQVGLFNVTVKGLSLSQVQNTGGQFINELKNIMITFLAAKAVVDGNFTLGMMLSVQYIIGQLNTPIKEIIAFLQVGQDAKISLERLSEIHSTVEEENSKQYFINELPKKHSIKLNDLSFSYNISSTVLKDINLEVVKQLF